MGFNSGEVSKASGIPIATVYRAVKSGALNLEDVLSVSWYVVGHLILRGDFSGVVDRVVDRSDVGDGQKNYFMVNENQITGVQILQ